MSKRGFTLLEVMIVVSIMGTLTVLSSQAIQQAIKNKVKLQSQIDDMSEVRDALKVIERDLNLAFHYTDLEMELKELIKKKKQELCKGATTTTNQPAIPTTTTTTTTTLVGAVKPGCEAEDPLNPLNKKPEHRADPVTHFVGKEEELYFATLNSSRLSEGTLQADFLKVAYLLQSCKKPGADSKPGKSCLVRRSSAVVEGDITKGGEVVVLLEDVTEFKLRYYGKGKQDWVNEWDSINGDAVAKNRFPDAVEISLKTEKGNDKDKNAKKKKISMQLLVPIRFTNNTYQDSLNNAAPAGGVTTTLPGGI